MGLQYILQTLKGLNLSSMEQWMSSERIFHIQKKLKNIDKFSIYPYIIIKV